VYGQAIEDPDFLADLLAVRRAHARDHDLEGAEILSVAWSAHRAVTGEESPEGSFSIRHPRLDPDWDFDPRNVLSATYRPAGPRRRLMAVN
jgi:hypothetical protein